MSKFFLLPCLTFKKKDPFVFRTYLKKVSIIVCLSLCSTMNAGKSLYPSCNEQEQYNITILTGVIETEETTYYEIVELFRKIAQSILDNYVRGESHIDDLCVLYEKVTQKCSLNRPFPLAFRVTTQCAYELYYVSFQIDHSLKETISEHLIQSLISLLTHFPSTINSLRSDSLQAAFLNAILFYIGDMVEHDKKYINACVERLENLLKIQPSLANTIPFMCRYLKTSNPRVLRERE